MYVCLCIFLSALYGTASELSGCFGSEELVNSRGACSVNGTTTGAVEEAAPALEFSMGQYSSTHQCGGGFGLKGRGTVYFVTNFFPVSTIRSVLRFLL